ncbi:PEP-CTERM sorting domain-containing protein [Verrucomicrobiaceae bacterium N1E253]|uniref:PEP-CTERM sorting domain-containing protein n=1 Tax=Oceaniferula marina TaxID=2748318 RepID=A0A851GEQ3_9BACT|nr:LamG-like jellyroll fold domain-containing protein [Oceaniferula marina]NWK55372.1 PEP-CTERM sorting domain-containing protein [Oceaniferula marina]
MKKTTTLAALASLTQAAIGAVSSTGLELYYTFESDTVTSTTVTDQWTGDGNEDNVSRNPLSTVSGKFGSALDTSTSAGTPRSASDPSIINSTFLPGTGDYSLTFWTKQDATTGNRLWNAGGRNAGGNSGGLQIYLLGSGGIEVRAQQPDGTTSLSSSTGAAGTWDGSSWNHIALVRTGTDLSLWVNGAVAVNDTLSPSFNIAVQDGVWWREANFGTDDAVSNAAHDDAAIFRRALSNAEIGEIYNGGTGLSIADAMSVPEPSAVTLLGLGGLALILRRRK